ncbi:MAG: hypothetical protein OXC07_04560 [Kistimonas sp.]|nr:hypothetical protein [Kistimonas sp.]
MIQNSLNTASSRFYPVAPSPGGSSSTWYTAAADYMITQLRVQDVGALVNLARRHEVNFRPLAKKLTTERLVIALEELNRALNEQGKTLSSDMLVTALSAQRLINPTHKQQVQHELAALEKGFLAGAGCHPDPMAARTGLLATHQPGPDLAHTEDAWRIPYQKPTDYRGVRLFHRTDNPLWMPGVLQTANRSRYNEASFGVHPHERRIHPGTGTLTQSGDCTDMEIDDGAMAGLELDMEYTSPPDRHPNDTLTDACLDNTVALFWEQAMDWAVEKMEPSTCNKDFYLILDNKVLARRAYLWGKRHTDSVQAGIVHPLEICSLAMTRTTAWQLAASTQNHLFDLHKAMANKHITLMGTSEQDSELVQSAVLHQLFSNLAEQTQDSSSASGYDALDQLYGRAPKIARRGQPDTSVEEVVTLPLSLQERQILLHQKFSSTQSSERAQKALSHLLSDANMDSDEDSL